MNRRPGTPAEPQMPPSGPRESISDRVLRHVVFPFHERVLRRRHIGQHRRFMETSQWWPRQQLLDYQWQELRRLLEHAYTQSPYWRRRFDEVGKTPASIRTYDDFQSLPTLTKGDIRAARADMAARDHLGRTWSKTTSGSTGEPFGFDYTPLSYDWRVAASRRGYGWAGYEEGMRQVSVWGVFPTGRPAHLLLKDRLRDRMAGRILVNALKLDEARLAECFDLVQRFKPWNIVGYTNPLHRFAEYVSARGGLGVPLHSVIAAAEKLHAHQRHDIEAAFGCPAFETYGCREFMLVGAECDHKRGLHVSAENLIVEVLTESGRPAAHGEAGELVITDLHNYGMPFIRYRNGDMAVWSDEHCSCGRGLPLLQQVTGRLLDVIRFANGTIVPGEFFPHVFKDFPEVRQYQAVQDDLASVRVRMVRGPSFDDAVQARVHAQLMRMFAGALEIRYEYVDEIALTPAGKLRVTVSNLGGATSPP